MVVCPGYLTCTAMPIQVRIITEAKNMASIMTTQRTNSLIRRSQSLQQLPRYIVGGPKDSPKTIVPTATTVKNPSATSEWLLPQLGPVRARRRS